MSPRPISLRLETDVENAFVRKARASGLLCRKLNGQGYRGWPDQMVLGELGEWFIEFKRPGKYKSPEDGLSANQLEIITKLRKLGKKVLVTDSVDEALKFVGVQ